MKYKVILVSKSFSQFYGVDYIDTFAPVAKLDSIKLVLAIVASKRWRCTIWMWRVILFMVTFMRIFICRLINVSFMILHLFAYWISLSMASSKLPELGMPRWTTLFSHKALKDANMILMCIWNIYMTLFR